MDKLHAPYNFVPLSENVHLDWGPPPSQDRPYRDGLSGTLAVTLTADTPLLVSGEQERADGQNQSPPKTFFRLPDDGYAIPGSSLRGMIRNVVEIASFGKFAQVDDRRFGLRDLTPAAEIDYRSRFTETVDRGVYAPMSRAGWLEKTEDGWQITPCAFARIDHGRFATMAPGFYQALKGIREEKSQDDRAAKALYDAWERHHGPMKPATFDVERTATDHRHTPGYLRYREAFPPGEGGSADTVRRTGMLVFTGQPGRTTRVDPQLDREPGKKHLEFVFLKEEEEAPRIVPPKAWQSFLDVHENQEKPSPTWQFWRDRYVSGKSDRIPVFYLADAGGEPVALGLSMMFKLSQDGSTHDLIKSTSGDHLDTARLDLAERVFGRIDADGATSLRGRVSVGVARLADGIAPEAQEHTTILAAPKPSFFPAYIHQPDVEADGTRLARRADGAGKPRQAQYRTYMPWNGKNEKLRGWKRYPARGAGRHGAPRPTPQQARNPQTLSRLRPLWLGDRLRFEGVIRFHNLRPVELGALVWAIEWGGNDRLRHGLGMGKPFGWGQVALRLGRDHERSRIVPNDPSAPAEPVADTLARCQDAFVAEMDRWLASKGVNTGWAQSEPIRRLRAMADPANAERNAPLRHMTLDPDGKANQFADAKKAGLVLQEYWEAGETPQITPPMLTDMKGLAGGGGGGRPGAGGTARKGGGASATGGGLFRKGERVTNIEEGEVVVVLADQAGPNAPVTIQYEDGMEDAVPAGILARR